jgi:hypothetical protein
MNHITAASAAEQQSRDRAVGPSMETDCWHRPLTEFDHNDKLSAIRGNAMYQ